MNNRVRFSTPMVVAKAWTDEETGHRMFAGLAATNSKDKDKERMRPEFIEVMKASAINGDIDLVEHHATALPIAKAVGNVDDSEVREIAKAKGITADALFAPIFDLDYGEKEGLPPHGNAALMYAMAEKGEMPWQFSVGGDAIGKKVFDKSEGATICELWPGSINHVMLTRAGKAKNPDTFPLGVVSKAEDWDLIEAPEGAESDSNMNEKDKPNSAPADGNETTVDVTKASESDINSKLRELMKPVNPEEYAYVEELTNLPESGSAIVYSDGKDYLVEYSLDANGTMTISSKTPVQPKKTWVKEDGTTVAKGEANDKAAAETTQEAAPNAEAATEGDVNKGEADPFVIVGLTPKVSAEVKAAVEQILAKHSSPSETNKSEATDLQKSIEEKDAAISEKDNRIVDLEKALTETKARIAELEGQPDPNTPVPTNAVGDQTSTQIPEATDVEKARAALELACREGNAHAIAECRELLRKAHALQLSATPSA